MALRLPKTSGMLRREAASWLARLQSGRDPAVQTKFQRWRDADPSHAAAFERVSRNYELAGLLRDSPAFAQPVEQPRQRQMRKPRYALAAAAALAVLVPAGLLLVRNPLGFGATEMLMLSTNVGEIRSVKLSDGSRITLDTATKVQVEIGRSARKARLASGRARFEVADSAKAFIVEAGTTTVITDHGVVDIEMAGQQSRVQVLAGSADVQQGPDTLSIAAGETVTATQAGLAQKDKAPAASDWTHGMLQFDGTPIVQAAAIANRYSTQHILIDDSLDQLRVTGAFRAGDVKGFAKALATAFHLSLARTSDGNLLLTNAGSASPRK